MFIDKYHGEDCLIIPIHQLISLTFIKLVVELTCLFITYKFWPVNESDRPQLLELRFFRAKSVDEQQKLREAISGIKTKINVNTGRDWVIVYMGYCFQTGNHKLMKNYANFFHDIDLLHPGVLGHIDYQLPTNSGRYKKYVQTLAKECSKWFVVNGCLPSLEEWTTRKYCYGVDASRRQYIQALVVELLHEKSF